MTPFKRRVGLGRIAVERDRALEGGLEQILDRRDRELARVVSDRHVAAVVLVPEPVRVLLARRDVAPLGDLVRREQRGVGERHRHADVEHVRGAAGAGLCSDGVDLVLAAAVRVRGVDLDAVLGREAADDGAIVGPIRWQRDDVELALLLGRRNEPAHAPECRRRCCRGSVDAAGSSTRSCRATRRDHHECGQRDPRARNSVCVSLHAALQPPVDTVWTLSPLDDAEPAFSSASEKALSLQRYPDLCELLVRALIRWASHLNHCHRRVIPGDRSLYFTAQVGAGAALTGLSSWRLPSISSRSWRDPGSRLAPARRSSCSCSRWCSDCSSCFRVNPCGHLAWRCSQSGRSPGCGSPG